MSELTKHLRNGQQCDEEGVMCIVSRQACHEAADHIEKLEAKNARLREALEPFARYGKLLAGQRTRGERKLTELWGTSIACSDMIAAHEALEAK